MRHQILAPVIGCALLLPGLSSAQQRLDPDLPGRTIVAGIGVRDAGDLETVGVAELGVRYPLARRVNGGVTIWGSEVPETECPAIPLDNGDGRCPGGGRITGLDLNLEFFYGSGAVHPYGVVGLGVGHLSLPDENVGQTAFAYSTGLGLGARAGRRVWLFVEGRWRQENFEAYRTHGLLVVFGAKWAF